MKRGFSQHLSVAAIALCVGSVGALIAGSRAEANARAVESDVAVVDIELVYSQLDELKDRNGQLMAQAQNLQKSIDEQVKALEDLRDEIDAIPASEIDRRREKEIKLLEGSGLLQGRQQASQQMLNLEEGDLVREMYAKIVAAVEEIGRRDGYRVVLFDTRRIELPKGGVDAVNAAILNKSLLYVDGSVDITNAVVTKMNNDFAAGG